MVSRTNSTCHDCARVYQGKGMVMAVKNRFGAGAATPQPFLAIVPYPTVLPQCHTQQSCLSFQSFHSSIEISHKRITCKKPHWNHVRNLHFRVTLLVVHCAGKARLEIVFAWSHIHRKQDRKPRSYASLKLQLTDPTTDRGEAKNEDEY